jgi:hypothetical protein
MMWHLSHRADPAVIPLADRHYNRQKHGAPQFAPPGRCLVLTTFDLGAFWVTSWPYAEYVRHAWAGAWVCSAFRRERGPLASELIRGAVAATRAYYGEPPAIGMVTFIDRDKVRPIMTRGRPTWGRSWRIAGFREIGETAGGLLALGLSPSDMPAPHSALPRSVYGLPLFGGSAS